MARRGVDDHGEARGCALLGSELRRLRGTRSLEDVSVLTKSPPLAGHVTPVSVSALSEIELGTELPKLTTLHALAMVYRVSLAQLMGYVVEGRLTGRLKEPPESPDDGSQPALFARLLSTGEWHRALAIASREEHAAGSEEARLSWRANRAVCLSHVGMHVEAVELLSCCLESVEASRRQQFHMLKNLGDIYAGAGKLRAASRTAQLALESIPEDATPLEMAVVQRLRASLIVDLQEREERPDERLLREAVRLTERVIAAYVDDRPGTLRAQCLRARAHALLGNRAVAARDLELVMNEASDRGFGRVEARAAYDLARLRVTGHDPKKAEALLVRAAGLAEAGQHHDILFEASFELFKRLRHDRPGVAVGYFRRCREVLPMLPALSQQVQDFDRVAREFAS